MTSANRYPSYLECVQRTLSASHEPLTYENLMEQIARRRPITKGARSAIDRALDNLYQAVRISPTRIGWLAHLITGSTIRHTLENDEIREGFVLLDELEHALFFPQFFQDGEPDSRVLHIELYDGTTLTAEPSAERDIWSVRMGGEFVRWLDDQGAQPGDDLIIQAVDGPGAHYLLRLQPHEARDEDAVDRRNAHLADLAEEIAIDHLRHAPNLYTWELVRRLFGRAAFADPLPPDDLHFVLHEYSRLQLVAGLGYELEMGEVSQGGADADRAASRTRGRSLQRRPSEGASATIQRGKGFLNEMDDFAQDDEDSCEAYEEYRENFAGSRRAGQPLSHDDFHLLEAELESLVDLELEFGYLLPDQTARKQELAERLFIDPESLVDSGWDDGDDFDMDSPALWN